MYKTKAERMAKAITAIIPDQETIIEKNRVHEEAAHIIMNMSFSKKGPPMVRKRLKSLFGNAFMGIKQSIITTRRRKISFQFAARNVYRVVRDVNNRPEMNITIYRAIMENHKGYWKNKISIPATISIHALKRRLERGFPDNNKDQKEEDFLFVIRDIAEHAETARLLGEMEISQVIPIALDEGLVLCRMDSLIHKEKDPILNVRTFLSLKTLDPYQKRLYDGIIDLYKERSPWTSEDLAGMASFEKAREAIVSYAARPREAHFKNGIPHSVLERMATIDDINRGLKLHETETPEIRDITDQEKTSEEEWPDFMVYGGFSNPDEWRTDPFCERPATKSPEVPDPEIQDSGMKSHNLEADEDEDSKYTCDQVEEWRMAPEPSPTTGFYGPAFGMEDPNPLETRN